MKRNRQKCDHGNSGGEHNRCHYSSGNRKLNCEKHMQNNFLHYRLLDFKIFFGFVLKKFLSFKKKEYIY